MFSFPTDETMVTFLDKCDLTIRRNPDFFVDYKKGEEEANDYMLVMCVNCCEDVETVVKQGHAACCSAYKSDEMEREEELWSDYLRDFDRDTKHSIEVPGELPSGIRVGGEGLTAWSQRRLPTTPDLEPMPDYTFTNPVTPRALNAVHMAQNARRQEA